MLSIDPDYRIIIVMSQLSRTASRIRLFISNGLLALLYYGMAELSRAIAATPQDVTPVWPPDGIAVAAIFLFGHALLPGVFLGSFLANIWAFWQSEAGLLALFSSMGAVLGIALGTTIGTGFGVMLWRRMTVSLPLNPFLRVGPTVKFLIYVGLCAPLVNATVGVLMLCLIQAIQWSFYAQVWLTWWMSNVSGIWIITPLLICWYYWWRKFRTDRKSHAHRRDSSSTPWNGQRWLELAILIGLVLLIGHGAFWGDRPFAYMVMPLLIWSAFRFGPVGSTSITAMISVIAIIGTVNGLGSFGMPMQACLQNTSANCNLQSALQSLQSFSAVIVFTTMVLVSVLEERKADARKLTAVINELETTNQYLEERVGLRTAELKDKNEQLADALSTIHQTQAKVIQSEKMMGLGQIVAGIAHEFNNPLSVILGNLKYLQPYFHEMLDLIQLYQQIYPTPTPEIRDVSKDLDLSFLRQDLPKVIQSMESGTKRMQGIVSSLRTFSRLDESYAKQVNIHHGMDSAIRLLQHRFQVPNRTVAIAIHKDYGSVPLVECYPSELNQVFFHLLTNAVDALEHTMPDTDIAGAEMRMIPPAQISIRTAIDEEKNWVTIAIADNGPGIPLDIQERIFEPFFSTKPIGKGTGMGLAISYQIITETHGGDLTCISSLETGTEFRIEIPCQLGENKPKK